jgi:fatty acid desaturase
LQLVFYLFLLFRASAFVPVLLSNSFWFLLFFHQVATNVLPLAAVGDFGALHCQPSTNVDKSTALDLTSLAPIAANGCYRVFFSLQL